MRWRYRICVLLLLCIPLAVATPASAQLPLDDEESAQAGRLFEARVSSPLRCKIDPWQPQLDFSLRFVVGYGFSCRLGLFDGKAATVLTYVRITPQGKPPVLLGSTSDVPEITAEMLRLAGGDASRIKNLVGASGVFALGEGSYSIEVLVSDSQGRVCRRSWKTHVRPIRSQSKTMLAMAPLTVQPLDRDAWQIDSPQEHGGLRLTIMLNAVPINPYQSTLRAWDRTILLECVYTLLHEIPYQSVRLIAFNLDEQREIYRSQRFDDDAFLALSHVLHETETATVSVQTLKLRNSPKFLLGLTNRELAQTDSSQAILYLGPGLRPDIRVGADLLARASTRPPFFYFEYVPGPEAAFPDAIQRLVSSANGKTFQIHSPAQLDQGIQKMLAQLKQD